MIVRESDDKNKGLYDLDLKEHYLIIHEWTLNSFQATYPMFMHNGYYSTEDVMLINGRGALPNHPELDVPLAVFTVQRGLRYRFRLINAGFQYCPIVFSIDGHNLTVIASDGSPIRPIQVESIVSISGERFDFVLDASQIKRDYWIKLRGESECFDNKLAQRAILRYQRDDFSINRLSSNMNFTFNDSIRHGLV